VVSWHNTQLHRTYLTVCSRSLRHVDYLRTSFKNLLTDSGIRKDTTIDTELIKLTWRGFCLSSTACRPLVVHIRIRVTVTHARQVDDRQCTTSGWSDNNNNNVEEVAEELPQQPALRRKSIDSKSTKDSMYSYFQAREENIEEYSAETASIIAMIMCHLNDNMAAIWAEKKPTTLYKHIV